MVVNGNQGKNGGIEMKKIMVEKNGRSFYFWRWNR
jgi:hypothetical protein